MIHSGKRLRHSGENFEKINITREYCYFYAGHESLRESVTHLTFIKKGYYGSNFLKINTKALKTSYE